MLVNTPLGDFRNLADYVEAIAIEYDYADLMDIEEYDEYNEYSEEV